MHAYVIGNFLMYSVFIETPASVNDSLKENIQY